MTRSEEDALAGILRVSVGGSVREVPTLKLKASRKWKSQFAQAVGNVALPDGDQPAADYLSKLATVPGDTMLELVLAYDVGNALSGEKTARANRLSVEDNMDDRDLYAALKEMFAASFPLVGDARAFATAFGPQISALVGPQLRAFLNALSASANSTNGASPNGVSAQPPLTLVSPTSS